MFILNTPQRNGFQITFSNGYTVSVQFGNGNYCSNHHIPQGVETPKTCENAEVALIHPDGWLVDLTGKISWWENDVINGWTTPNQVAELIAYATLLSAK